MNDEDDYSLECKIIDRYLINGNDAIIIRKIEYINNFKKTIQIDYTTNSSNFFIKCDSFEVKANNKKINPSILKSEYSQKIFFPQKFYLRSKQKLEIDISCKWKNFVNFMDIMSMSFTFTEPCKYNLSFEGIDFENNKFLVLLNEKLTKKDIDYKVTRDGIIFNEINVNDEKKLIFDFIILFTPDSLNTLSHAAEDCNKKLFSNYIIIVIQHLLSDFIHLIESFIQYGAVKEDIFIIGIPYSTKEKVIRYLHINEFNNLETPVSYPFLDQVVTTLNKAILNAKNKNKKIVIIEDGGYAVPIIHKKFTNDISHFIGAVEQTANGIWRDRDLIKKVKGKNSTKKNPKLLFPVINVAESEIKARLESPLIGKAVVNNLLKLLGLNFTDLSGKKVGLVGYGRTGSKIAEKLKSEGAIIKVRSTKSIDNNEARRDGFEVVNSYLDLIRDSDLIIEATGQIWGQRDEILALKHGSWFISASSKRLGIDYNEFKKLIDKSKIINLPNIGKRYQLKKENKNIVLVADGYPINFFNSESVPDRMIEFIPTLLFKSTEFLINKYKILDKDIIDFNKNESLKKLEAHIAEIYGSLN
jgi:S-adenosylhomocysteine hydrolase